MADTPFIHLHCHTDYSLLDGACEVSQLMDTVAVQKMPAVAMTATGICLARCSSTTPPKPKASIR